MGTIADKLNYLSSTKSLIAAAITDKGQAVYPSDTFRSYADKVEAISGGGGGGYPPVIMTATPIKNGIRMRVDTVLADTLSVDNFTLTSDTAGISLTGASRTSDLSLDLAITLPSAFDTATVTTSVKGSAFKYQKSNTNSAQVVFTWLYLLIGDTDNMRSAGFVSDDGSSTFTLDASFSWPLSSNRITSIIVSGNSNITFGGLTEAVKVNRRDTYAADYLTKYFVALNGVNFKVTWTGYSPYNSRVEANKYVWELYFFCNGDAMLTLVSKGASATWDGTNSFIGATFNSLSVGDCVSFYRRNAAGTSASDWEIDYAIYDESKSSNLVTYSRLSVNLNDGITHPNYYTSGTTFYYEVSDSTLSYVVPIEPGSSYVVEMIKPGDRFRLTTMTKDPRTLTAQDTCVRSLVDNNSTASGDIWSVTAQDSEYFLNLYMCSDGVPATIKVYKVIS